VAPTTHSHDYVRPYVEDLRHVVDLGAVARAGLRLGVDPLGGASLQYWDRIADTHRLDSRS
jgi:phosphoglucomutase